MISKFPIKEFKEIDTPFYFYDVNLLKATLKEIKQSIEGFPYRVHYAIKANANPGILKIIKESGFGVDCVSGGELKASMQAGFESRKIVFAGVAKTDNEIQAGIDAKIQCFNVESINELEVINQLAGESGRIVSVSLRVNPNIDAHTHKYITTGLSENKFGINLEMLPKVVSEALDMKWINLCGLHFHIGSQITEMEPFKILCDTINSLVPEIKKLGADIKIINVGGGLGIDYANPNKNPIPDFKDYFDVFKNNLILDEGQELHFELGRSIVAQCGSLITRVIFVKEGISKKFVMVDAGMTDLIRPALYQAHHNIENISTDETDSEKYDVVGPICESSDTFGVDEVLPVTKRGDLIALRSAGAYGEIMASRYNCRELPGSYFSE